MCGWCGGVCACGVDADLRLPATGLDRLVEPLRATCTTKVKAHSVKQEFEKQDELKRSALRAVVALLNVPDAGEGSGTWLAELGTAAGCICSFFLSFFRFGVGVVVNRLCSDAALIKIITYWKENRYFGPVFLLFTSSC